MLLQSEDEALRQAMALSLQDNQTMPTDNRLKSHYLLTCILLDSVIQFYDFS